MRRGACGLEERTAPGAETVTWTRLLQKLSAPDKNVRCFVTTKKSATYAPLQVFESLRSNIKK